MKDLESFVDRDADGISDELVVILHGYGGSLAEMQGVKRAVRANRRHADIYLPKLSFAGPLGWFCTRRAEAIVREQMDAIKQLWFARGAKSGTQYRRIILVGHSFGSVTTRKLAILAHGETPGTPFEPRLEGFKDKQPWADAIERIVLLAGMHGGWAVSSAMNWIRTVSWRFGEFIGEVIFQGRLTIFAIRKGAPFLIQTRLQWLALMRRDKPPQLTLVQLLGTVDDLVAPDDTIDYAVDFEREGSFFLLEVPETGHYNAVDMAPADPDSAKVERWKAFSDALSAPIDALKQKAIPREDMADSLSPKPDKGVKDVVFVIHGIRDKGFWTQKIARAIKREARAQKEEFRSVTASYGYFAMAPFVFPWVRRQKVAWLMDRYTEARARYPKAKFSYVGHSNGTYLVARALQDYPAARFKHVVFAGSVVRCDYNWHALMQPNPANSGPRVERVLNYVATGDIVVALLPKAMQPIKPLDLGSAGHDGFRQGSRDGPVHQIEYVIGRHGAGLRESQWDDIARFIVAGIPPPRTDKDYRERPSAVVRKLGNFSTALLAVALLVVTGFAMLLLLSIFQPEPCIQAFTAEFCVPFYSREPSPNEFAARTVAFLSYLGAIYLFVTRF